MSRHKSMTVGVKLALSVVGNDFAAVTLMRFPAFPWRDFLLKQAKTYKIRKMNLDRIMKTE